MSVMMVLMLIVLLSAVKYVIVSVKHAILLARTVHLVEGSME